MSAAGVIHVDPGVLAVLPSQMAFRGSIGRQALVRRVTAIRCPPEEARRLEATLRSAIEGHQAGTFRALRVGVMGDPGSQMAAALRIPAVTPEAQAVHRGETSHHVLLIPDGDGVPTVLEAFARRFASAANTPDGRSGTLHVYLQDSGQGTLAADPLVAIESYSDLLPPAEIRAYITVRSVGRPCRFDGGLAAAIVEEISCGDPLAAEWLLTLSDDDLLEISRSAIPLPEDLRRPSSVIERIALARGSGPEAEAAQASLDGQIWRASVRVLLPWLDIQRGRMVSVLRPSLERLHRSGQLARRGAAPGSGWQIAIDEVEFNDIYRWHKYDKPSPFIGDPIVTAAVVQACGRATALRNMIAHHKAPDAALVSETWTSLKQALGET